MARMTIGGGNLGEFFALATNAFGTKQTHVEDRTKTTKVSGHPEKNKVVIDLDASHTDSNWETFLGTYLYPGDLSVVEQTYEDGTKDTQAGGSTSYYLGYIHYFATNGATRRCLAIVGILTGNTGDLSTADKQFEATPVQITAVPAPATYTIPASAWNTLKVSGAATATIAADSYGFYTFWTAV